MERIEINQLMRVEDPIIKGVLYDLWVDHDGKEEIKISGYDMGNRMYVVKHLDEKHFIAKVPSSKVLCGARGCGMVFSFNTKYYLARISDEKIPAEWNSWCGKLSLTHEIRAGKKWKDGIALLEEIWKGEATWIITVSGYGEYFFIGNEEDAERERSHKAKWEQGIGRKRLASEEEVKTKKIDLCKNHPNFHSKDRYKYNCGKCLMERKK
jgi:hypothetical protein